MYKIVALFGEAGTGKDFMLNKVLAAKPEYHGIISCTTRPMRQGEQHGVNYFYYTDEQFQEKINADTMLESVVFNNWYYGTSTESVCEDKINIGVFNPQGIHDLLARGDCEVLAFRLRVPDMVRMSRQLSREENPDIREVCRRFLADYSDFGEIDFPYTEIKNVNNLDAEAGLEAIVCQIEHTFGQGRH